MKVLYILHDSSISGSTISFLNMLYGLMDKGIKPYIVLPTYNNNLTKILEQRKIDYSIIEMPLEIYSPVNVFIDYIKLPVRFIKLYYNIFNSLRKLYKLIDKVKPLIIHTNSGVIHSGYKLSKFFNIPHVWHIREYQDKGYNWRIFPSKTIFKKRLKDSYTITITKDLLEYFDLANVSNATCIYNGVLSLSDTKYLSEKENYLLVVGRVSPEKKIEDAIHAFKRFLNYYPYYKLKIIGECDLVYQQTLKQICTSENINKSVEFCGFKEKEYVLDQMSKAAALIVPSEFEGFGRMTAEALFMGCPVVGRNSGGTKEIINNAGGGVYYYSIDSLTNILCDIVSNKIKLDMKAAQKYVNTNYTIESNIINVYQLYNRVLKSYYKD